MLTFLTHSGLSGYWFLVKTEYSLIPAIEFESRCAFYLLSMTVSKKSKYGGKDQESIQSSNTPDPGYQWESDKNIIKHYIQESQVASPFPAGDHKAATNSQESMTNTKY